MSSIFLCYRREESAGYAGRLHDRLAAAFGREQVFMDIDTIEPGVDFVEAIEQAMAGVSVVVVMIGPKWLHLKDERGNRRLDNPNDFVRVEVATGLKRNIRVVPVLIDNADMPSPDELPPELAALTRRNALKLSHSRFHTDVDLLLESIRRLLAAPPSSAPRAKAATTAPAPKQAAGAPPPAPSPRSVSAEAGERARAPVAAAVPERRRSRLPVSPRVAIAGAAVLVLVGLGVVAGVTRGGGQEPGQVDPVGRGAPAPEPLLGGGEEVGEALEEKRPALPSEAEGAAAVELAGPGPLPAAAGKPAGGSAPPPASETPETARGPARPGPPKKAATERAPAEKPAVEPSATPAKKPAEDTRPEEKVSAAPAPGPATPPQSASREPEPTTPSPPRTAAAEAAAGPSAPIPVAGKVRKPVKLSGPEPQYTDAARQAGIEGEVVVEAVIDETGNVTDVKLLEGLPEGLGEATAAAISQWRFEPATLDGKPVAVFYSLRVRFKLEDRVEELLAEGRRLGAAGDFMGALDKFNEVIKSQPGLAEGYYQRGLLFAGERRRELAATDLRMGLSLDPAHPLAARAEEVLKSLE